MTNWSLRLIRPPESPATKVLVFLLTGLKNDWKWPIGYWYCWLVDKIKSPVQSQLIKLTLLKCQEHNINVVSIIYDGVHSNLSTFHLLGYDLYQPYDDIKCYFNDGQKIIYFTPYASHNIKLARNTLGSFKTFLDKNNNLFEWWYIANNFLKSKIMLDLN